MVQRGLGVATLAVGFIVAAPAYGAGPAAPATAQQLPSPVTPVAVFGRDQRALTPGRYRHLAGSLGLLFNNGSRTACSAFCVGSDTIATAAHCLFPVDGRRAPPLKGFWFARRYERNREVTRIAGWRTGSASQFVMAGSMRLNIRPPIDATRDWAFVRLERPVCRGRAFRVRSLKPRTLIKAARAKRIFQLAYHRDFANWRLAYSKPCRVSRNFRGASWSTIARDFSNARDLILHMCDTGAASSGSPILMDTPNGPVVIGINVGTYVQSKVLMQNGRVTKRYKADSVANTGVNARAFADQLYAFRSARIIETDRNMRLLQIALQRRGLYLEAIDGLYGPATNAAIRAYERRLGQPQTGLATIKLLRQLGVQSPRAYGSRSSQRTGFD
ncbi:MAG: peptidoglycan-binding protein [Pseudomonadota bacterium]